MIFRIKFWVLKMICKHTDPHGEFRRSFERAYFK